MTTTPRPGRSCSLTVSSSTLWTAHGATATSTPMEASATPAVRSINPRPTRLTVNVSGNGSVSVPSGTYVEGTVLTLTAMADPGWTLTGWSGALSGNLVNQALTMNQDKTVNAIFTQDEYSLGVQVVGSGSVSRNPLSGSYYYGDVASLDAAADVGWSFSGWSGDLDGDSTHANVTMDGNKAVVATFTQNTYSVNAGASGGGRVVLSPQLDRYSYGDEVVVQAVPDPGYAFQSWSGDLSGDGSGQVLTIDGNKSVTAQFGPAAYTVETSVVGNGSITLDPDQATYAYGDVIQVTATPDPGWHFTGWGLDLSGITATQSLVVVDNTALQAVFEPDTYTLNVAWIGGGSATKLSDKSAFDVGEVVTVTAMPDDGYLFNGWRDESSDAFFSASLTTTVTMTAEKSIVALFGFTPYTVTVNIVGSGTVTPTDAIYALGDEAVFTATAGPGWLFAGWSGDASGIGNPVTLTVGANTVITAAFTENPNASYYTLTTKVVGSGVVTPAGGTYVSGTVVPITATADVGWTFAGWSGALSGSNNPTKLAIDGDKVVTATFAQAASTPPTYTLSVRVVGSGGVTPTGGGYLSGTVVPITATADVRLDLRRLGRRRHWRRQPSDGDHGCRQDRYCYVCDDDDGHEYHIGDRPARPASRRAVHVDGDGNVNGRRESRGHRFLSAHRHGGIHRRRQQFGPGGAGRPLPSRPDRRRRIAARQLHVPSHLCR